MSFMDQFKKYTQPYDDDDLNEGDELDLGMDAEEPAYARATGAAEPSMGMDGAAMGSTGTVGGMGGMGAFGTMGDMPHVANNPIDMGTPSTPAETSKYRVVIIKPDSLEMARTIADQILQGDTVILNCEETDEQVARRIIDFLCGCAHAINGSVKKATNDVIIFAPNDVGVDDAGEDNQLDG